MTKVWLVDDDESLLKLLGDYLARLGYDVETSARGIDALVAIQEEFVDLVLLDVRMPDLDGWQTLERLRRFTQVPVIMLTALGDEPDVLKGFSLGADDYVPKPFSFAQLAARMEAVLRRATVGDLQGILESGELTVDLASHRVRRKGQLLSLTPTEFRLLVTLMEQPGKVLTSRELAIRVWGPEYADDTDYVRRYIWHLRRRIEQDSSSPVYIHNERGVGYYFSASS